MGLNTYLHELRRELLALNPELSPAGIRALAPTLDEIDKILEDLWLKIASPVQLSGPIDYAILQRKLFEFTRYTRP